MELTIEQPCPSCGAEISLKEDDRLVQCGFCDVNNYMVRQPLPRYVLPAVLPSHISEEELLYVPYLRFKGSIYYCQGQSVHHKLIDTTRTSIAFDSLPLSLGLRPQTMKVLPVTDNRGGRYVLQTISNKRVFGHAAQLTMLMANSRKGGVIHRAFIGETVSRVYLPLYLYRGLLYDGVNHIKLGDAALAEKLSRRSEPFQDHWQPRFLSTLCPECGDDLQGSGDSLVLICATCNGLYEEKNGKLDELKFSMVTTSARDARYLPFWKIRAENNEGTLKTLADFIRLTHQAILIKDEHQKKRLTFLIPAFKVNPKIFLQLARKFTLSQLSFKPGRKGSLTNNYPVTLELKEAVQSLKSVLAASAVEPKRVMDILPNLQISAKKARLNYIPFIVGGPDYIEQKTGISITRAALRYGRNL